MKNVDIYDLDMSVKANNVMRAQKIKTLGDMVKVYAPEGIFQKPKEKIKGTGDVFYYEIYHVLGEKGLLKEFEKGTFPKAIRKPSQTRMLTDEEVGKDGDLRLGDLGFSIEARILIGSHLSRYGFHDKETVRALIRYFLRIKPHSGDIFLIVTGIGRHFYYYKSRFTVSEEYKEKILSVGLPEIKKKLQELNYLK